MAFLDETGLAELWSLITAEDDEIRTDVLEKHNASAKFAATSYVGTANAGYTTSVTLTFPFVPRVVVLDDGCIVAFNPCSKATDITQDYSTRDVTWNDTNRSVTVSGISATKGTTYKAFAIGG